jgi:hypothetical protein
MVRNNFSFCCYKQTTPPGRIRVVLCEYDIIRVIQESQF